jgi:hypothetical protein
MRNTIIAARVEERVVRFVRIALLAVLFAPGASFGQAIGQTKGGPITFDVPFAFVIDGQQLPAGSYTFAMQAGSVVRLFQPNGRNVFTLTHSGERSGDGRGKLVFHHYGDVYFLASVSIGGGGAVHELYATPAERQLQDRKAETELAIVLSPNVSKGK